MPKADDKEIDESYDCCGMLLDDEDEALFRHIFLEDAPRQGLHRHGDKVYDKGADVSETEFYLNGVKLESEEDLMIALEESQDYMRGEEKRIQEEFGVSDDTASAILYLRSRSRWTLEKELELIEKDRAGNPISLGKVLSGEF